MLRPAHLLVPLLAISLQGCIASAAADIITAPVRVAGRAADLATTSQSEADQTRGREMRQQEERLGRLERQWRNLDADCRDGSRAACQERDEVRTEMDGLMRRAPSGSSRR